jgi:hypothetical protein
MIGEECNEDCICEMIPFEVTITSPNDGAEIMTDPVMVKATATSPQGIVKIEFLLDGILEWTDTEEPYEWELVPADHPLGPHTVTATAHQPDAQTVSDSIGVTLFP